jgi:cell division protein FtsB
MIRRVSPGREETSVSVRKRMAPVIPVTRKSVPVKVMIGLLVLLMMYVGVSILIQQTAQMDRVLAKQAEIQVALAKEEAAVKETRDLYDSFGSDAFIEKIAREKLDMLLPGEILFVD